MNTLHEDSLTYFDVRSNLTGFINHALIHIILINRFMCTKAYLINNLLGNYLVKNWSMQQLLALIKIGYKIIFIGIIFKIYSNKRQTDRNCIIISIYMEINK